MGLKTKQGVILAVEKRITSPLLVRLLLLLRRFGKLRNNVYFAFLFYLVNFFLIFFWV